MHRELRQQVVHRAFLERVEPQLRASPSRTRGCIVSTTAAAGVAHAAYRVRDAVDRLAGHGARAVRVRCGVLREERGALGAAGAAQRCEDDRAGVYPVQDGLPAARRGD